MSSFKDECGVFAVYNDENAAYLTVLGLHALQHRGQESCGIASSKSLSDAQHKVIKHVGLVSRQFTESDIADLAGSFSIGHVRYSTSGGKDEHGIQPWNISTPFGDISLAHNGNLTNYMDLREKLLAKNVKMLSAIDTEAILLLIASSDAPDLKSKIYESLCQLDGAFSLVIMCKDFICVARDKHGIRPLSIGKTKTGGYIASSETCAFSACDVTFERDILHGEILFIHSSGQTESLFLPEAQKRGCIFEYIYFARPDSVIAGVSVYEARKKIGYSLAKQHPVEADVVVPVPSSGVPAAIGFSMASGIPCELGIIRNHYIGRTFIDPNGRTSKVSMKHSPNVPVIAGKSVILIDDSIVRGTTSKRIVQMLFDAGAKDVHMRISSPPTKHSCYYGIDTPDSKDLIANRMSKEEIREYIGATSLEYITINELYKSVNMAGEEHCDACFTGHYITELKL